MSTLASLRNKSFWKPHPSRHRKEERRLEIAYVHLRACHTGKACLTSLIGFCDEVAAFLKKLCGDANNTFFVHTNNLMKTWFGWLGYQVAGKIAWTARFKGL